MNFTNISNAIKAIDGVKNKPEYTNLRIAHGKDRCANPPRSGPQGASGQRRTASGTGIDGKDDEALESDAVLLGGEDGQVPVDSSDATPEFIINSDIIPDGAVEAAA